MLKKLAGQTALYGVSSILGRTLNYFLVPLHTSVFKAGEFGDITGIYALVAFLNVVYTFGLETTYFRFASNKLATDAEKAKFYGQSFSILALVSVSLSLILYTWADQVAASVEAPGKGIYIRWMVFTMLIDAFVVLPFAKLRLEGKALRFVIVRMTSIVLTFCLNHLFLGVVLPAGAGAWGSDWQQLVAPLYDPALGPGYVFLANLIANGVMALMLVPQFIQMRLIWSAEMVKRLTVYAWPLLIMGMAGMVDEMLSRLILVKVLPIGFYDGLTNKEALGVFGACYKLSIFMSLAIQAFRYAADPFFFSKAQERNAPEVFAKVMHAFVIVCLSLFVGVSLNLWWLAPLFLKKAVYLTGLDIVPVLLLANMLLGVYYNLTVWFKLTDNTRFGTYISLGGAAFTLVANLILIPILGYMGSALVTMLCYLLMSVACYLLGQRYWPVPYQWAKTLRYVAIAVGLVLVQQLFGAAWHPMIRIAYTMGSVGLFAGYAIWAEGLSFAMLRRK